MNAAVKTPNMLEFFWNIAGGYYLYRDKIKWVSLTPGIDVGATLFPTGEPSSINFLAVSKFIGIIGLLSFQYAAMTQR